MIRRASFSDIPTLTGFMLDMHAASKYVGRVGVDEKFTKAMFMAMIQRHGGQHDGATLVNVVENRDGSVAGFMVGMLDRVYHVGDMLAAKDALLYVQHGRAGAMDAGRLIAEYIAWAEANPKVYEINLSWTDTIAGAERIEALYLAKGFRRSGAIYERVIEKGAE